MNRQQQRTRESILVAMATLIETKKYQSITVQHIIDQANIGRSTFYTHFKTKDELVEAMCEEFFIQVRAEMQEKSTDAIACSSHDTSSDLKHHIQHIFLFLNENKFRLTGILKVNSAEVFIEYFTKYISELLYHYLAKSKSELPTDFYVHHLAHSFIATLKWWLLNKDNRNKCTPEQVSEFFFTATGV